MMGFEDRFAPEQASNLNERIGVVHRWMRLVLIVAGLCLVLAVSFEMQGIAKLPRPARFCVLELPQDVLDNYTQDLFGTIQIKRDAVQAIRPFSHFPVPENLYETSQVIHPLPLIDSEPIFISNVSGCVCFDDSGVANVSHMRWLLNDPTRLLVTYQWIVTGEGLMIHPNLSFASAMQEKSFMYSRFAENQSYLLRYLVVDGWQPIHPYGQGHVHLDLLGDMMVVLARTDAIVILPVRRFRGAEGPTIRAMLDWCVPRDRLLILNAREVALVQRLWHVAREYRSGDRLRDLRNFISRKFRLWRGDPQRHVVLRRKGPHRVLSNCEEIKETFQQTMPGRSFEVYLLVHANSSVVLEREIRYWAEFKLLFSPGGSSCIPLLYMKAGGVFIVMGVRDNSGQEWIARAWSLGMHQIMMIHPTMKMLETKGRTFQANLTSIAAAGRTAALLLSGKKPALACKSHPTQDVGKFD